MALKKTDYNHMKKLATAALLIGILALGACASSKPCPAYAKATTTQDANS
jgi:Ni,Fe-hydrogenase I small subunit